MKGDNKMKTKYFLQFAEQLTGIPKNQIKVISCNTDSNGLMHGTIEIDGNKEHIHEYHN